MGNFIIQLLNKGFKVSARKDAEIITVSFQSNYSYVITCGKGISFRVYWYDKNGNSDIEKFTFSDEAIEFIVNNEASYIVTN